MSEVPCKGCTACCRGFQAICLFPEEGDIVENYDTMPFIERVKMESNGLPLPAWLPDQWKTLQMIKFKENGDCIYLGEHGCTIYDNRPILCRSFDCRKNYLMWTKKRRMNSGQNQEVFTAGKQRINTLTGSERLECIAQRKMEAA